MGIFASSTANVDAPEEPAGGCLPTHVAMIMDGNGRWAKARNLPRTFGHREGAKTLEAMVEACVKHAIPYLTVYAFSSENWNRSTEEVQDLMQLLQHYLADEVPVLHKHGIRVKFIGDHDALGDTLKAKLAEAEALTEKNARLTLIIALSYGARQEILQATQRLAADVASGKIAPDQVNDQTLEPYLYTHGIPEPDLLIRTGGDHRLSNFLLWQCAYTELYFTPTLWPDFTAKDFETALSDFSKRERRFGHA